MSVKKYVEISCDEDGCDTTLLFNNRVKDTRKYGKSLKWKFREGKDFCPQHGPVMPRHSGRGW